MTKKTKACVENATAELYHSIQSYGVAVMGLFDHFGSAICHPLLGAIYVNPALDLETKFFVFIHEVGHVFTVDEALEMDKRDKAGTEYQANATAIAMIGSLSSLTLGAKKALAKRFIDTYHKSNAKWIRQGKRRRFRGNVDKIVEKWHNLTQE